MLAREKQENELALKLSRLSVEMPNFRVLATNQPSMSHFNFNSLFFHAFFGLNKKNCCCGGGGNTWEEFHPINYTTEEMPLGFTHTCVRVHTGVCPCARSRVSDLLKKSYLFLNKEIKFSLVCIFFSPRSLLFDWLIFFYFSSIWLGGEGRWLEK